MSQFESDNNWQRGMRDRFLAPHFYRKNYEKFVFLDGRHELQRFAIDTIASSRGILLTFEEKIVRWNKKRGEPLRCFALETMSCTVQGCESPGWMKYGDADFLLYCFANEDESALVCYQIDFQRLQEWFWPRVETWHRTRTAQINRSECRVVPITDVTDAGMIRKAFRVEDKKAVMQDILSAG